MMNPDTPVTAAITTPELWTTLLKSAGMLCLVLGILVLALFLIRRFYWRQNGAPGRGLIRMLASHHLAPKERVVLMEVMGEKILIGVTQHQISCLARLSGDMEMDIPDPPSSGVLFSNLLKGIVGKDTAHP